MRSRMFLLDDSSNAREPNLSSIIYNLYFTVKSDFQYIGKTCVEEIEG